MADSISHSLISLVDSVDGDFVASYAQVDSLGAKVYILFSSLLGGFPLGSL